MCKKTYGEICTPEAGECAVGACTDNRCCRQTCGVCQKCTGTGGTCVAVTSADDPDTCTDANTCDVTGACKKKDGQTCSVGSECRTGFCDGTHLCRPRCVGLAATCGPSQNGDCCASHLVPGGSFYRFTDTVSLDASLPATVSDFYLDKYEITVGRFRLFVDAGKGTQASPPAAGDGSHPLISGSGWNSSWNAFLAADTSTLNSRLRCGSAGYTWTDTAGANDNMPLNCLDWHTAFAFCAWEGGRLATAAEWNYAASGGGEQRHYPWSSPAASTVIDGSYAVYDCCGAVNLQKVGSRSTKGDGKWGQADLAGNLYEWVLDNWGEAPVPCVDCADLKYSTAVARMLLGGAADSDYDSISNKSYSFYDPDKSHFLIGARCARTVP